MTTDATKKNEWDIKFTPPRKIIQISASPEYEAADGSVIQGVVALCDDGSLWELRHSWSQNYWQRLLDIPQDEK